MSANAAVLKIRKYNSVLLLLFLKMALSGDNVIYFRKILEKFMLVLCNFGG